MAAFTQLQAGDWSNALTWHTGTPSASATQPAEGSFETPDITSSSHQFNPGGSAWTFNGRSGIIDPPSAYSAPSATAGSQIGFIQNEGGTAGQISQAFTWPAGDFYFALKVAQRAGQVNPIIVKIDSTTVGTITPASTSFVQHVFGPFTVSAGSHTLTLLGGASTASDNTTFIDEVLIADSVTPSSSDIPTAGDTVEGTANLTVDDDTIIGDSPADADEYVLTVVPDTDFTIEADQTLEVLGAAWVSAGLFTMEEGSRLEFNSSSATGTPAYVFGFSGGEARFVTNGTAGNRVTVTSDPGGDEAIIQDVGGGGVGKPQLDLNYTDISLVFDTVGEEIYIDHCTLTGGGTIGGNGSNTELDIRDSFFMGVAGWDFNVGFLVDPGRDRNWARNSFEGPVTTYFSAGTLTDNYFGGGVGSVSGAAWTTLDRNFISSDDFPLLASANNNYILTDHNDGNPHSVLPSTGVTLHGSIIEYSGDDFGIDAGNCFYAPSSTGCTFSENIVGWNAHGIGANGAVTFAGGGGCDVYKCCLNAAQYSGGILLGDGGGNTGTYPNVKGNIFWVGLGDGVTGVAAYAIDTTTDNIITPANCTHNLCINLQSTRYMGDYPTTQPGASDTVVTGVNVLTILHDPYRNIGTWAVERGSVEVDYDDQKADALAYMLADPSLVLALVTHVKAGSAIINGTYKGLAHDGFDHGPAWRPIPLEPATADGDEVTFADWNHTLDTGVVPDAADFVFRSGRTCSGVTVNAGSLVLTGVSPVYDGSVVGDYVTYVPGADPITADDTSESERWAGTVNDETAGGGYTLTADAGAIAITGTNATLRRTRIMPADAGAVAIAGTAATLSRTRVLAAGSGSVEIQGQSAQLRYSGNPGDFVSAGTFISAGPPSVF